VTGDVGDGDAGGVIGDDEGSSVAMARFDLVTIDTPDTTPMAAFWCAALELVELEREDVDRWVVLGTADGQRRIGLQRGRHRGGGIHLDLACEPDGFTSELERLVELGARLVSAVRVEPYGRIANLVDPDGNPFDLCAYG
jgi:predicted enzyme related to lactoylglutathione lyase